MEIDSELLVSLTTEIVAAHVGSNSVPISEVGTLISEVYDTLQGLGTPPVIIDEKPKGAISARASIKPDHLISMIDGKGYKMLKRHLSQNGYTPEAYREAFNLPKDYPMVAAAYAEKRRALAISNGLGRKPKSDGTAGEPKPPRKLGIASPK